MFTAQLSGSLEATFLVLLGKAEQVLSRYNAVIVHATSQLFIKTTSLDTFCPIALVELLEVAEQLGVSEAFACVPKASMDCEELVEEILELDFSLVSPRGLGAEFVLLRFQF